MHIQKEVFFGVLSALVNLVGFVPYLLDILKRKTKPERATWWIYSTLFILLFAAQRDAQAGWLLATTMSYIVSAVAIAFLSIKYGYGKFHARHLWSVLIAIIGLVLWLITDRPILAIVLVIVVDFAGFWLTMIKTWYAPHSETLISWQAALLSYILSLFAVSHWSIDAVVYPLYAMIGGTALVSIILFRRGKVAADIKDF